MSKNSSLDDSCFIIKTENDLFDIFDMLLLQGFELLEAYNLIAEKYSEEFISKLIGNENISDEDENVF
jgi:hypothetical protein